jgi:hypothetical protein
MENDSDELDRFKRSISLQAYAAAQGYEVDRKESWAGSAVMRHPDGDKIVITRDRDGHFIYFSVRDPRDHGSIVDFIQRRKRLNLGEVRKELRRWSRESRPSVPVFHELVKTPKDRQQVISQYCRMQDARRHAYLETERCIPDPPSGTVPYAGRARCDRL